VLKVGIDIGGTKIAGGVVDSHGRIVEKLRVDTPIDTSALADAVVDMTRHLASRHDVVAVGVAAAGFIDRDRATVIHAPNIAWHDEPLKARLEARIDVPVTIENDANAAGWAEFQFGVARDATDMLMLTVGTGLGGAIVVDRALVRGKWGVAAEVGHMRVVPGGHYCGCGHEGCWEQYASGTALVRDAQGALIAQPDRAQRLLELSGGDPAKLTGPQITQAAQEGDPLAVELLANLGRWIGEGAASVTALLDPELIVIGGGVGAAGDLLLQPIRRAFAEQLSARGHRPEAQIELAEHGNEAGIVGAADLARR
jgi:glucokinase